MSATTNNNDEQSKNISDVFIWQLIAWIFSIVGALVAYLAGPRDPRILHWEKLSISFFIVYIAAYIASLILGPIPYIGRVLSTLIWLAVLVIWVVGIIKIIQREEWRPPILWDIAEKIPL